MGPGGEHGTLLLGDFGAGPWGEAGSIGSSLLFVATGETGVVKMGVVVLGRGTGGGGTGVIERNDGSVGSSANLRRRR